MHARPNRLRSVLALTAVAAVLLGAGPASSGPLENLERERALLIAAHLDRSLDAAGRRDRAAIALRRLIDLERMVMRDPGTRTDTRPIARRAFADYELTFLAHASVERELSVVALWLERLGITSDRLLAARLVPQ